MAFGNALPQAHALGKVAEKPSHKRVAAAVGVYHVASTYAQGGDPGGGDADFGAWESLVEENGYNIGRA